MKLNKIRKMIDLFNKSGLDRMEIKDFEGSFIFEKNNHLSKEVLDRDFKISAPTKAANDGQENDLLVKAPFVGTFYTAPAPGKDNFVNVGDHVHKGQTLAIIEAMKIENEIKSSADGDIKKIFVSDGGQVEFDQALFEITKAGDDQ